MSRLVMMYWSTEHAEPPAAGCAITASVFSMELVVVTPTAILFIVAFTHTWTQRMSDMRTSSCARAQTVNPAQICNTTGARGTHAHATLATPIRHSECPLTTSHADAVSLPHRCVDDRSERNDGVVGVEGPVHIEAVAGVDDERPVGYLGAVPAGVAGR